MDRDAPASVVRRALPAVALSAVALLVGTLVGAAAGGIAGGPGDGQQRRASIDAQNRRLGGGGRDQARQVRRHVLAQRRAVPARQRLVHGGAIAEVDLSGTGANSIKLSLADVLQSSRISVMMR